MRRRLDAELVRRGLADGLVPARAVIDDGRVLVGGAPANTSGRLVDPSESVAVTAQAPRFVGRGGEKLAGALDGFGLDPDGLRVLDAGASTGGFSDVLLQRGAARVVALDVGHGQLHEKLRSDPRVEVHDRTNLRHVDPTLLGPFGAVVADLSFISLTKVMDVLVRSCAPGGWIVVLVKPQFEAPREEVSRGRGVITDPAEWTAAVVRVVHSARTAGAELVGLRVSPLRGAEGNVEFLVQLRRNSTDSASPSVSDDELARFVDGALSDAGLATGSTTGPVTGQTTGLNGRTAGLPAAGEARQAVLSRNPVEQRDPGDAR